MANEGTRGLAHTRPGDESHAASVCVCFCYYIPEVNLELRGAASENITQKAAAQFGVFFAAFMAGGEKKALSSIWKHCGTTRIPVDNT